VRAGSLHVTSAGAIGVIKRTESLAALGPAAGALHRVASGILPREDRPKIRVFPDTGPHHILVTMTKPPAAAAGAAGAAADAAPRGARGRPDQRAGPAARPPKPRAGGQQQQQQQQQTTAAATRPSAFASAAAQQAAAQPPAGPAQGAAAAQQASSSSAASAAQQQAAASLFDAFADVPALLGRLRRKFRSCGIRVSLTAELGGAPGSAPGGSEVLRLHLTPLRAGRALATCFLALKLQVPFERVTVLAFHSRASGASSAGSGAGSGGGSEAASKGQQGEGADGGARAAFCASDAEDWVAGVQRVLLLPQGGRGGAEARGFRVSLAPYEGGRVQLLLPAQ
jgi:hypothetical protein